MRVRINITNKVGWVVVLVLAGISAAWGLGRQLFEDPATEKSYPNKTVAGFLATTSGRVEIQTMPQPTQGQFLRAGVGTGLGTSTATSGQFATIQASDVQGLPSISGTIGYLPVKTSTGWDNSPLWKDATWVHSELPFNMGSSYGLPKFCVYDDGNYASCLGAYGGDTLRLMADSGQKRISLGWWERSTGVFHVGATLLDTTLTVEGGLVLPGLTGMSAGNVLFFSDSSGTVAAKALTPGAVGAFDPMGTYFLESFDTEGPAAWHLRWNEVRAQTGIGLTPQARTATCSTGNDGLIGGLFVPYGTGEDGRAIWPGGDWRASLRAKVNANAAAIRIEVWDVDAYNEPIAQWFSWTTDTFSNTTYATIQKQTSHAERVFTDGTYPYEFKHRVAFKLYATCSTSTTVSVEFGDASYTNRIESPIPIDKIGVSDVSGLSTSLAGKEPLTYGITNQVVCFSNADPNNPYPDKSACNAKDLIPAATTSASGLESAADKTRLDAKRWANWSAGYQSSDVNTYGNTWLTVASTSVNYAVSTEVAVFGGATFRQVITGTSLKTQQVAIRILVDDTEWLDTRGFQKVNNSCGTTTCTDNYGTIHAMGIGDGISAGSHTFKVQITTDGDTNNRVYVNASTANRYDNNAWIRVLERF